MWVSENYKEKWFHVYGFKDIFKIGIYRSIKNNTFAFSSFSKDSKAYGLFSN